MLEIKVLTDEEFEEREKARKRDAILKELQDMTSPSKKPSGSKSFSIKDFTPSPKIKKKNEEPTDYASMVTDGNYHQVKITDDWDQFMANIDNANIEFTPSPIDDTTTRTIFKGFQLDEEIVDGDKFSKVFTKELAMLAEVLKEVKHHGTNIRKQLENIFGKPGGKGSGARASGITKNLADLVNTYNGIHLTEVNIIREMANLKAKQVDWSLKDKKDNSETQETVEGVADQFYKSIMNGNSAAFIQKGTTGFTPKQDFDYDPIYDDQASDLTSRNYSTGDPSELDGMAMNMGFNPTQPFNGYNLSGSDDIEGDPYGYIAHEKNPVEICVYDCGNDKYQFAAVDSNGDVIDGVELPSDEDPDIVNHLSLRPGSNFVYDKLGRKYRLIEMGPIDTSDIDDMPYPYNN